MHSTQRLNCELVLVQTRLGLVMVQTLLGLVLVQTLLGLVLVLVLVLVLDKITNYILLNI